MSGEEAQPAKAEKQGRDKCGLRGGVVMGAWRAVAGFSGLRLVAGPGRCEREERL